MNGNVFSPDGKCPTLTTNKGEGPKVGRMIGVKLTKDGAFPFKRGGGGMSEYSTISYETSKSCTVTAEHPPKVLTGLILAGEADNVKGHAYNRRVYAPQSKCPTLNAATGGNLEPKVAIDRLYYRKFTVTECERAQTVPDGYTKGVSNTQAYKMIGNGWTVDVIAHIFSFMGVE